MDTVEKQDLAARTRARNDSLWIALDWGGLMTPLAAQAAVLDDLGQPGIESFMAIIEENWDIKEEQRDRTYQVDQFAVDQDRQIADDKVGTGRAKLAIQRATDEYTLAVKVRDAVIRGLLMGAKEYAAQVELEQLAVAESGAILAVAKEGLHQKQVNASIYYEYIQRAMVEADIAKAQVEVAKANVRAIMSDIAAGEADIKVITAQIEQYMAQADKAGLQADVANIFAEIMVKKLSAVKLGVGQAEIAAGFSYIQSRLDDALAMLGIREREETLKTDYANAALVETGLIFPDEQASEDLRKQEIVDALEIYAFTKSATAQNIQDETALKALSVVAKEALSDQKMAVREGEDIKKTWAQALVNAAHEATYKSSAHYATNITKETEYIHGE